MSLRCFLPGRWAAAFARPGGPSLCVRLFSRSGRVVILWTLLSINCRIPVFLVPRRFPSAATSTNIQRRASCSILRTARPALSLGGSPTAVLHIPAARQLNRSLSVRSCGSSRAPDIYIIAALWWTEGSAAPKWTSSLVNKSKRTGWARWPPCSSTGGTRARLGLLLFWGCWSRMTCIAGGFGLESLKRPSTS